MSAQSRNLVVATTAFTISFWAWNVVGPLAVRYTELMALSATQQATLVATPVLVGSAGRILSGALTDRYGGRAMMPAVILVTVPFVLLVAFAGNLGSYPLLLIAGFFLGIAGTTFAVGMPFINAWYAGGGRGFATGVFGAGMGGTALSAFITPRFVEWFGYTPTHLFLTVLLVATAAGAWLLMEDAPHWQPNHEPVVPKLAAALKLPVTWQMSVLYAVFFGGFVAFSTYLPTYLNDVYDFDLTAAGTRTAGFAVAAVVARPIGGSLSDRFGARTVALLSCVGVGVMAVVLAAQPPVEIPAGASFLAMAVFLGFGTGAVFAWVTEIAPRDRVGSVTGVVGAAGGLGGFFPPLVMGATYNEADHSYTIGLGLLCLTAVVSLAFTAGIRQRRPELVDA